MQTHAENRSLREALARDAVLECLRGTLHLRYPDEWLALFITHQGIACVVQRDEVHFEMSRVGNDANDDAGEDAVDGSVVHGVRMMRIRVWREKRQR
jgi:hypothetical protein